MTTRRRFLQTAVLAYFGAGALGSSLLAQTAGPGEIRYTIRKGDTLSAIAQKHGVTVNAIKVRNKLRSDAIIAGRRLIIPGAVQPLPAFMTPVVSATKAAKIRSGRWKHIVAHHSGIEDGNAKAYDGAHRRRGMEHGLAYHFVIGNGRDSGEGEIEIGPRWHEQLDGGHVRSQVYNQTGIGICMVGNFENRRPSAKQYAAFTTLVAWLRDDAPLGLTPDVTVHRWVDRNHTVCPGKLFPYTDLKRRFST